jgi:hypothetical protein
MVMIRRNSIFHPMFGLVLMKSTIVCNDSFTHCLLCNGTSDHVVDVASLSLCVDSFDDPLPGPCVPFSGLRSSHPTSLQVVGLRSLSRLSGARCSRDELHSVCLSDWDSRFAFWVASIRWVSLHQLFRQLVVQRVVGRPWGRVFPLLLNSFNLRWPVDWVSLA